MAACFDFWVVSAFLAGSLIGCSGLASRRRKEKTIDDYHTMQGFSYLDDGFEGEETWRTI
jgi:hypothetical protein